jgi:hypothetical protein
MPPHGTHGGRGLLLAYNCLMPASPAPDHDQRLKVLLKEFFGQFLLCFFPAWAARFDFKEITWLDKEVFHGAAAR